MIPAAQIEDEAGWFTRLRTQAAHRRVPLSATLELTRRCNFRCVHCYLGDQRDRRGRAGDELPAAELKEVISEWAEAGVFNLLITGGDPMIRPDFADIYRHAAELGMVVIVFCNGARVTETIADLFRELPPRKVEVTLYGATAATYEAVTRTPGAHAHAWRGIHRLRAAGVRVGLKMMLLILNAHELAAAAAQAEELGCDFRYDPAIFPCLEGGGTDPLAYRVPPEEVLRLDLAFPGRQEKWEESVRKHSQHPDSPLLYPCSAGRTSFFFDASGHYSPCLTTVAYRYPRRGRRFLDIWFDDLAAIRDIVRRNPDSSFTGERRAVCPHCPALNYLETGEEEVESPYMRGLVELRYGAVKRQREGEGV